MEDEVLTKQEVLEKYKIGRFILDKAMKNREIDYIKFGRKIIFKTSAVEKWLLRNTTVALSEDELKKIKQHTKK